MELNRELLEQLPLALRGEIDENVQRKDFTQSELAAVQKRILDELRKHKTPGARTDLKAEKVFSDVRATGIVGRLFNESHKQVEKRLAVVEAAEAEPEKFGKLAADMDRCDRVNGAYRRLSNMREAERIRAEPPPLPNGKWRVGVCDVPWPSEPDDPEPAERGYWPFATMSLEALAARSDIGERLHEDAVLWFWVTNFHMRYAFTILEAWGFRETPTILTWDKGRPGRGQRLLGQTEHAIMAIRGKPVITLTNETTLLRAPAAKPLGRKPPEFYALVERLCPARRYLDIFSRYQHSELWTCWGADAPAQAEATP